MDLLLEDQYSEQDTDDRVERHLGGSRGQSTVEATAG